MDRPRWLHRADAVNLIHRASSALGVPTERFRGNRNIDDLLDYFRNGELPEGQTSSTEFVRPRLLRVMGVFMAVRSVERRNHPLFPMIKEAYVAFSGEDRPVDVSPWSDKNDRGAGFSHTFSSIYTAQENLQELTNLKAASMRQSSNSQSLDAAEAWLEAHRDL